MATTPQTIANRLTMDCLSRGGLLKGLIRAFSSQQALTARLIGLNIARCC
jgi:hypothetical protein